MSMKEIINLIEKEQGPDSIKLYRLLELAIAVTGRGEVENDYTKLISFPINDIWISCDSYYGQIEINLDDVDYEDVDDRTTKKLIKELKKRLLSFDRKIKKKRDELVKEIFDKPIDNVLSQ